MSILSGRESSVNGKCQLLENDTKQYCSLNGAVMLGGLGSRHLWKFFFVETSSAEAKLVLNTVLVFMANSQ